MPMSTPKFANGYAGWKDEREDESWDGPTPRYAVIATLDEDTSAEDVIVYLSHTIAQLIDAGVDTGKLAEVFEFLPGSEWDRDWDDISGIGMTETEVSFILSGMPREELIGLTNIALGLSVDSLIRRHGPTFFMTTAALFVNLLSRKPVAGA